MTRQKNKRGDIEKWDQTDSPEIPDRGRHQKSPASLRGYRYENVTIMIILIRSNSKTYTVGDCPYQYVVTRLHGTTFVFTWQQYSRDLKFVYKLFFQSFFYRLPPVGYFVWGYLFNHLILNAQGWKWGVHLFTLMSCRHVHTLSFTWIQCHMV